MVASSARKRADLTDFIERELSVEECVRAVVCTGSVAAGTARIDSDIDAFIFMDPFDPFAVPAEFAWRRGDGSILGTCSPEIGPDTVRFDFTRVDLLKWSSPNYVWPDGVRAELSVGWLAFDRDGRSSELIADRVCYSDTIRIRRLDEALVRGDLHLCSDLVELRWDALGPLGSHEILGAAWEHTKQAAFAMNRRWMPWPGKQSQALAALPLLPHGFAGRALDCMTAAAQDFDSYVTRAGNMRELFHDLVALLHDDPDYGEDPIGAAFRRMFREPGRSWSMEEWRRGHEDRLRRNASGQESRAAGKAAPS